MQALLIALGNPLRGDDGAARVVVDRLQPEPGVRTIQAIQAAPELAQEMADADAVFFLDADAQCGQPRIEPLLSGPPRRTPVSHFLSPSEVLALARRLYGFQGRAYLCHIPAASFDAKEGLSPQAETGVRLTTEMLRALLCR